MTNNEKKQVEREVPMPALEEIRRELSNAKRIDNFFGKEGIFARLFGKTPEHMLEAELSAHLGYEKYAAKGRNSGNSRNGSAVAKCSRAVVKPRSSATIALSKMLSVLITTTFLGNWQRLLRRSSTSTTTSATTKPSTTSSLPMSTSGATLRSLTTVPPLNASP
jgi:hypothetical protein